MRQDYLALSQMSGLQDSASVCWGMSLIKKDSSSVRNILQVVCRRKEKIMAYTDKVLL